MSGILTIALPAYMSETRDRKCFTMSVVAADWHVLMIPQRTMRPSIVCTSKQLNPRCSVQIADIPPPPLSATLGFHLVAR